MCAWGGEKRHHRASEGIITPIRIPYMGRFASSMGAWHCLVVLAGTVGTAQAGALVPELACPAGCNSQGYCHDGVCVCYPGWTGPDCSTESQCPHQCNLQGALAPARFMSRTHYLLLNAPGTAHIRPTSSGTSCAQVTAPMRPACATRASLVTTVPSASARKTAPVMGSAITARAIAPQTSRVRLVISSAAQLTARRRIVSRRAIRESASASPATWASLASSRGACTTAPAAPTACATTCSAIASATRAGRE